MPINIYGTTNIIDCGGGLETSNNGSINVMPGAKVNITRTKGSAVLAQGDVAPVQSNFSQIENLLTEPSLKVIKEELLPLLNTINEELKNPQPKKSLISNSYSGIKDYLAKSVGSGAGSVVFQALKEAVKVGQDYMHLHRWFDM